MSEFLCVNCIFMRENIDKIYVSVFGEGRSNGANKANMSNKSIGHRS